MRRCPDDRPWVLAVMVAVLRYSVIVCLTFFFFLPLPVVVILVFCSNSVTVIRACASVLTDRDRLLPLATLRCLSCTFSGVFFLGGRAGQELDMVLGLERATEVVTGVVVAPTFVPA